MPHFNNNFDDDRFHIKAVLPKYYATIPRPSHNRPTNKVRSCSRSEPRSNRLLDGPGLNSWGIFGGGYGNIFLNCAAVAANFLPGIRQARNHRRHCSNGTTKARYPKSFQPVFWLNSRFSGRASPSAKESRNGIMPLRWVTWSPP
jgi:hypothetical protein